MTVKISFAARSETGKVRSSNEDNLYCNGVTMTASTRERPFFLTGITEAPALFAVCDGMGGEDCGELASLTAVEELSRHAQGIIHGTNDDVNEYVNSANTMLTDIMTQENIRMGTTLALAALHEDSFSVYNLGDSRIYRVRKGKLQRITDDHTLAEDKVRMGYMTAQKAEESRERHILTRYLGVYDEGLYLVPDVNGPYDYEENTRVLLSSDGLNEMLNFRDIARIMESYDKAEDAVNALVDAALFNGGRDNVTCIVLEFKKEE